MSPDQRKEERFRQDVIASQSQSQKNRKAAKDKIENREFDMSVSASQDVYFIKLLKEAGDAA